MSDHPEYVEGYLKKEINRLQAKVKQLELHIALERRMCYTTLKRIVNRNSMTAMQIIEILSTIELPPSKDDILSRLELSPNTGHNPSRRFPWIRTDSKPLSDSPSDKQT